MIYYILIFLPIIVAQRLFPEYDYFEQMNFAPSTFEPSLLPLSASNRQQQILQRHQYTFSPPPQSPLKNPPSSPNLASSPLIFPTLSSLPPIVNGIPPTIPSLTDLDYQGLPKNSAQLSAPNHGLIFNVRNAEYSRSDLYPTTKFSGFGSLVPRHQTLSTLFNVPETATAFSGYRGQVEKFNGDKKFEEKILDKILTHLPQIAASVLKFGTTENKYYTTTTQTSALQLRPSAPKSFDKESGETDKIAAIINEMPNPKSIFSFGKLISSMERQSVEGSEQYRSRIERDSKENDLTKVNGRPMLKSLDGDLSTKILSGNASPLMTTTDTVLQTEKTTPSLIMRLIQPLLNQKHEYNSNSQQQSREITTTQPSDDKKENLISSLMSGKFDEIFRGVLNQNGSVTKAKQEKEESIGGINDTKNSGLLSGIMNGKLSEINWTDMFLGSDSSATATSSSQNDRDEGNALAQLFNGLNNKGFNLSKLSSLFGSGLDDDPSIPNKFSAKRNF